MAKPSRRIDVDIDVDVSEKPTSSKTNGGVGLAEWRARRIVERTLPSGLCVRLRTVKLEDLMMAGKIPQTLNALAKRAQDTGFGLDDIAEMAPLIDVVFTACLIDPPIADQADDTHATLDEFGFADRIDVFAWANGAADAVRPFLAAAAGRLEPTPDQ